jgi:hypothetical protein
VKTRARTLTHTCCSTDPYYFFICHLGSIANRVCVVKQRANKPCHTLSAGERFITSFGVVEVVQDNRAIPVAELASDIQSLSKKWKSAKMRRDQHAVNTNTNAAVQSLARRCRLSELYTTNNLTQVSVFAVYFGMDPRRIYPDEWKNTGNVSIDSLGPDPATPTESYPDRIVCCKLVPDRRKFLTPVGGGGDALVVSSSAICIGETRMFLRRSELKEEYMESLDVHVCSLCGNGFLSLSGYKYHVKLSVCVQSKKKEKEVRDGRFALTDQRAQRLVLRQKVAQPKSDAKLPAKRQATKHRAKYASIYPQVLLALGFKVLPRGEKPVTVSAYRPCGASRSFNGTIQSDSTTVDTAAQPDPKIETEEEPQPPQSIAAAVIFPRKTMKRLQEKIVSPDEILSGLYANLRAEQSMSLGPVYPSVFKALGFPDPKHVLKSLRERQLKKKRKIKKAHKRSPKTLKPSGTKASAAKPPAVVLPQPANLLARAPESPTAASTAQLSKPLPPIVDVNVLVGEIEAGRYPSIKRVVPADTLRGDRCALCKKEAGGRPLLFCTFCPQSFHWSCLRRRFTIKDPEPEDDLMCHCCIGVIHSRRVRAQKRRLEKQVNGSIVVSPDDSKEAEMDEMLLVRSIVEGREYECVAAQVRRINDLTELMRDAELRVSNCLELSRINAVRRQTIASCETRALF